MIKYMHVVSIDSSRVSGSFKSKIFARRFSKQAIKWFDSVVDKNAIGHLTAIYGKGINSEVGAWYYKTKYEDSIGNIFMMWSYKIL